MINLTSLTFSFLFCFGLASALVFFLTSENCFLTSHGLCSKALNKEITSLKKSSENHTSIKNKITKENYKLIKKTVAQKVVILEHKIKSRQNRKKERDHIQHATAPQKRNRRFKRNIAIDKRKEKRKRYKARKKDDIKEIIENAPDQNAINLSNAVLSEDQKTFLKKGPSFIPTPTDINWYDVRKDFTKFINKIRHFADVSDQPVQQQQQKTLKTLFLHQ